MISRMCSCPVQTVLGYHSWQVHAQVTFESIVMPVPPKMLPDLTALALGCEITTQTPHIAEPSGGLSASLTSLSVCAMHKTALLLEELSIEAQQPLWVSLQTLHQRLDNFGELLLDTKLTNYRRPMQV
jgi:hypothetical protein